MVFTRQRDDTKNASEDKYWQMVHLKKKKKKRKTNEDMGGLRQPRHERHLDDGT